MVLINKGSIPFPATKLITLKLNKMKTIVTNLLTQEKDVFVNNLSLTENIINSIIVKNNQTSNLLNPVTREKYRPLIKESTSKLTGRKFAFCEEYDLHATVKN